MRATAQEPTGKRASNYWKFTDGLSAQTVLGLFAELCVNMFPVKMEENKDKVKASAKCCHFNMMKYESC